MAAKLSKIGQLSREELATLSSQYKSKKEMAESLGVSKWSVVVHLNKHGIELDGHKESIISEPSYEEFKEQYENLHTLKKVAEFYGVSIAKSTEWATKFGLFVPRKNKNTSIKYKPVSKSELLKLESDLGSRAKIAAYLGVGYSVIDSWFKMYGIVPKPPKKGKSKFKIDPPPMEELESLY